MIEARFTGMQTRMVEFIRALRAAGVRISLAESQDAMFGVEHTGIRDVDQFKSTLKATLIKDRPDQEKFDYYFPLFFSNNKPPLDNINEQLSPEDQELLQQALEALMGKMDALRELMQRLLDGQPFSDEELQQIIQPVRSITGVQLVVELTNEKIKNKEHLDF